MVRNQTAKAIPSSDINATAQRINTGGCAAVWIDFRWIPLIFASGEANRNSGKVVMWAWDAEDIDATG